jgi:DNA replication protein DnaC
MMGECGFDRNSILPHEEFSFFDPNKQATDPGRREARNLLDVFAGWTAQGEGTKPLLLIAGGVGVGKTDSMRSSVWQMKRRGLRPYYITASEFDIRIKGFRKGANDATMPHFVEPDEWLERLSAVPILAFDDVGAGVLETGFVLSRLERLFADRYQNRLPTAVSTNLSAGGFTSVVGPRVYSRFMDTRLGTVIDLEHCHDMRPLLS